MITSFLRTWRFILNHPLASRNLPEAIKLWFKWQVGSRILKMPVVVPFIKDSQLVAELGMTGATGNIYTGLHEFTDMAFCLHLLRVGDLFVDVGANIGSYTVLSSKVVGANSLAIEPVPTTYKRLRRNININDISSLVDSRCCAAGKNHRSIKFSSDMDTTNQVVAADYKGNSIEVPVESLDYILEKLQPTLIKIDVEGFEPEVIEGSRKILTSDSVLAVLLETVDPSIEKTLRESGFQSASYDPFQRELKTSAHNHLSNNYLWIRNLSKITDRCKTAPKYQVLGVDF
ncbi:FkbM family methyltransferase [Dolichospermum circinale]|uniref:FkbM family methyltransferase n=1 Tax=Dolichospermum circinale TaxID=109265 RepID=UPI00232C7443|nr:FkbM family methyltransferase [Dolichospermum circinale]MDB9451323.1 FkbM family methyltransferase [Dolichospermum circinale CS-547]